MPKTVLLFSALALVAACASAPKPAAPAPTTANPLLMEWTTPFGVPPFDAIRNEHFIPAFEEGMKRHLAEIDAIVGNPAPPDFANTVEALEASGALLTRATSVFFALNAANTDEGKEAISKAMAPKLAAHGDSILLNEKLFLRVKAVWDRRDALDLGPEQAMLLKKTWTDFVRNGADLPPAKKEELKAVNQELSTLTTQFNQNLLKENNGFVLVLDKREDLAGLPDDLVAAAAEAAKERGMEGKWAITLDKPSWIPFLQYSTRRDLRETIYNAWMRRGDNNNAQDNKKILSRIAALRVTKANLLGFPTYAAWVLDDQMAKTPQEVTDLLRRLWPPALARAKADAAEFKAMMNAEGIPGDLKPSDWWYYAEKQRKAKYALDDAMLKPYFKLENVIAGAFDTAARLYGIGFTERKDLPVYHPDVRVFEVKEADGRTLGILYTDYFPRPSKRGGAWMDEVRKQSRRGGKNIIPVVFNVGNFTKPTPEKPSLLTFEEVETLFHEFGHALHGLLSDCTYERLSGTAVPTDFVELFSQIMENWASEPEVLKTYARHYRTGEPIPQELIDKIQNSSLFNQGFNATEYLAASILDMDWHTLTVPEEKDARAFEKASMDAIGLIPEIIPRYRSPYFAHIFGGGYAAGYYSYIWAEVLDADAFEAFKEKGIFDPATARSFRQTLLSRGGTEEAMDLYVKFRGRKPSIEPLLKRRGLQP
jgi:peptidyl-dipeptidase Dcp